MVQNNVVYDEFGYASLSKKTKCTCTHAWLMALGFKARDIYGHHPRCKITKLRLKSTNTTSGKNGYHYDR